MRTGPAVKVKAARLSVVTSASNRKVRGGERIRLFLEASLPSKMHVYAPGVIGYIPIAWELEPSEAVELTPITYPPSRSLHLKAINETVPVYEKTFTLRRDIIFKQKNPTAVEIKGTFRYQACDETKCYVPETVPLSWGFQFEPHDSARVPEKLRRKTQP
ncbi:MAG: protein-disulfide reductase DsbD domain-containing protein [Bryobacteraceae bacterium]